MLSLTRYLVVSSNARSAQAVVSISASRPVTFIDDFRYSPILPAYLQPRAPPPPVPELLESLAFFFSSSPYSALGKLKGDLKPEERDSTYFTQGLASIILANCSLDRVRELNGRIESSGLEFWHLEAGRLDQVVVESPTREPNRRLTVAPLVTESDSPEVHIYLEQISASLGTLAHSYPFFFPEEVDTLQSIAALVQQFANAFVETSEKMVAVGNDLDAKLRHQKERNAILSAFVELSAALSYAVTQGTTGASPILSNRSPFPHHSLLGVGGAVRATTRFVRYIEKAFSARCAAEVIRKQYADKDKRLDGPGKMSKYQSGPKYKIDGPSALAGQDKIEQFDRGGAFPAEAPVPLIAHFSLLHGFKETKFSVTAAAEALSASLLPQWTLMTLSHEVIHSRVRAIFQALFGAAKSIEYDAKMQDYYIDFKTWRDTGCKTPAPAAVNLRNAVLEFCCAMERADFPVRQRRDQASKEIGPADLWERFLKYKLNAVELFVHFHDYYFIYACQPDIYTMSLWASWTKVAAPVARPMDYLTRTLASLACGSGKEPGEAFSYAIGLFIEGITSLEDAGVKSPLFSHLKRLLDDRPLRERAFAFFKPSYYLIDQVRLYFASPEIVSSIDRLEIDPHAEGSESAETYSISVYGHGDSQDTISPVRFILYALLSSLRSRLPIDDPQWLTAWSYLVVAG